MFSPISELEVETTRSSFNVGVNETHASRDGPQFGGLFEVPHGSNADDISRCDLVSDQIALPLLSPWTCAANFFLQRREEAGSSGIAIGNTSLSSCWNEALEAINIDFLDNCQHGVHSPIYTIDS